MGEFQVNKRRLISSLVVSVGWHRPSTGAEPEPGGGANAGRADQRARQHRWAGEQEQARAKERPQQHWMKQLYAQTGTSAKRSDPCLNLDCPD